MKGQKEGSPARKSGKSVGIGSGISLAGQKDFDFV
jgi:hypothetical protein